MAEKKLKVVLLSSTPNAEKLVALAAKLCYSPANIEDLLKKITEKDQKDFVEKLIEMTHMSPVEHVVFTFGIEGISRACTHQLVRHRLASYSQQSQRYVKEENLDYILPPLIKDCKFAVHYNGDQWFEDKMKEIQKWYKELIDKGILPEDARFLLPNAAETKIIITMNARELLHFFKEFYIIYDGVLEVVKEDADHHANHTIKTLHAGETIGEMALVDNAPRSASIYAKTDSKVLFL